MRRLETEREREREIELLKDASLVAVYVGSREGARWLEGHIERQKRRIRVTVVCFGSNTEEDRKGRPTPLFLSFLNCETEIRSGRAGWIFFLFLLLG
jgi:hypothetical protein